MTDETQELIANIREAVDGYGSEVLSEWAGTTSFDEKMARAHRASDALDTVARRLELHDELVTALRTIANSEAIDGDTVVCDFDSLQSVARATLAKLES